MFKPMYRYCVGIIIFIYSLIIYKCSNQTLRIPSVRKEQQLPVFIFCTFSLLIKYYELQYNK